MAYSGTVGQTVVSVQKFIDQGARMSGKLAEELTVEQVQGSKQALFFILSNLINQGINYWCISKKVYGLKADQYEYLLPLGGNDVLNALYRTLNRPSGSVSASSGIAANATDGNIDTIDVQTAINGNITINYGTNNPIYAGSIGILPGTSGSYHILLEYSTDGSTWKLLQDTGVETWVDNEWLWYDIDPGANVQYYRMRETGGNTLAVREFFVGNNSTEVTMARLNRDDYTNLPNKNFTANQPYQYWFNRTLPQSKIVLWPAPSDPFVATLTSGRGNCKAIRSVLRAGKRYGSFSSAQPC